MQITDKMREVATTTIFSMADVMTAKQRYYITDWAVKVYADLAAAIGYSITGLASTIEKESSIVDIEWMGALMDDFTRIKSSLGSSEPPPRA
jgi:hypothetical protein